jgi:hypothetical protein
MKGAKRLFVRSRSNPLESITISFIWIGSIHIQRDLSDLMRERDLA